MHYYPSHSLAFAEPYVFYIATVSETPNCAMNRTESITGTVEEIKTLCQQIEVQAFGNPKATTEAHIERGIVEPASGIAANTNRFELRSPKQHLRIGTNSERDVWTTDSGIRSETISVWVEVELLMGMSKTNYQTFWIVSVCLVGLLLLAGCRKNSLNGQDPNAVPGLSQPIRISSGNADAGTITVTHPSQT